MADMFKRCNIDGDMADRIVQYTLFGEVQFG